MQVSIFRGQSGVFALRVEMQKQKQEIGPALQLASVVIWVKTYNMKSATVL